MHSRKIYYNRKITLKVTKNDLCALPIYVLFFIAPMGSILREVMPLGMSPNIFPAGMMALLLAFLFGLKAKVNLTIYLIGLYISIMSVSLLTGPNVLSILTSHIGYLLIAFLLANYRFGEAEVRSFFNVYIYSLIFVVALSFLELFTSIQLIENSLITEWGGISLITGPFENQNAFSTFLMVGGLCVSECFSSREVFPRIWKWLIFIVLFCALLLTASRSATLGLVVGLFIQQSLMFANKGERRVIKVGAIWTMIIVLLTLSIGSYFDFVFLSDLADQKSESTNFRLEAFDLFITSIIENPFFGSGYQNIWYETEAIFGFEMGAHNMFLGTFIDFGIFAFLIFVYLFGKGFLNIRNKLSSSNIEVKFAHTVLALITALLIHGQFHEIQVNTIVWLILLLAIFFNKKSSVQSVL